MSSAPPIIILIGQFMDRCAAARSAGGISDFEACCGTPIPPGYWHDSSTFYWIPPNVRLLPMESRR